jgi:hypothetical protein
VDTLDYPLEAGGHDSGRGHGQIIAELIPDTTLQAAGSKNGYPLGSRVRVQGETKTVTPIYPKSMRLAQVPKRRGHEDGEMRRASLGIASEPLPEPAPVS